MGRLKVIEKFSHTASKWQNLDVSSGLTGPKSLGLGMDNFMCQVVWSKGCHLKHFWVGL